MLEAFDQGPHRFVERRGDIMFFSPLHNRAVHEIHFGLPFSEHVLQHAGVVFAGSVRAFLHQGAGIPVELDAHGFCDGFAFGNHRVEKFAGGGEASCGAVMKKSESANWICGSVEDEFSPLSAARVIESDDVEAGAIEQLSECGDSIHGSVGRLEGANPSVASDVVADVAGLDDVTGGKSGAANDVADALGDDFFVADAILHGADGAGVIEDVSGLFDCAAGVSAFCGDDSEIANRNFFRVGGGVNWRSEIGRAGKAQSFFANRFDVIFRNIVCVDFRFAALGEMRREDAANRSATNYADFHALLAFMAGRSLPS